MIYGHEDKKDFFIDLVERDQLGHAYLFYGEPQVGKFLFTQHLANYLEKKKFEVSNEQLIDSTFIQPGENGSIGIDELRELKKFLFQKPLKSVRRLAVINNAEKMTPQAQGSMLKVVEESPEHTTFIFVTFSPSALLRPLASRLFKIYFERIKKEQMEKILKKDFQLKDDEVTELIKKSFGRMGRVNDLINKTKKSKDVPLDEYLEGKILDLYTKNKKKNAEKIKMLLNKESEIKRFNLNPKLQEKVVKEILKK